MNPQSEVLCEVFLLSAAMSEDFDLPIEEIQELVRERHEQIYYLGGIEYKHELFDEYGEVYSVVETYYGDEGKLTEVREFVGNLNVPVRVQKWIYDAEGRILKEQLWCEDELINEKSSEWDGKGRLIRTVSDDKENPLTTVDLEYDLNSDFCFREQHRNASGLFMVVTYTYGILDGKKDVIDELVEMKLDHYATRRTRYYSSGEMENGVIVEIFNENVDYIEEVREVISADGLVTTYHTCIDPSHEAVPYFSEVTELDVHGNIVLDAHKRNNRIEKLEKMRYDAMNRLIVKYVHSEPEGQLYFYRYTTKSTGDL